MEKELYNLIWDKLKMIYDKVERLEKKYDTLEKNIKNIYNDRCQKTHI